MWGNGQLELMAELNRPCVSEVVCFGFGSEGLRYGLEQHLMPAVYDDDTGRKYLLDCPLSSGARDATVNFRPDRQTWSYEFEDLGIDVSLILPRLMPGYLFKLELSPKSGNRTRKWRIYHQLRGRLGNMLQATEAKTQQRRPYTSRWQEPAAQAEIVEGVEIFYTDGEIHKIMEEEIQVTKLQLLSTV